MEYIDFNALEKALCDKLYTISPVGSVKAMQALLFDDLRVDESDYPPIDQPEAIYNVIAQAENFKKYN